MIRFAEVALGVGEPVSCHRCEVAAEPVFFASEAVVRAVQEAVAAWSAGPGPNVALTGPEPFTHPELPALISAAREAGAERIRLRTEAGALTVPGNARGVVEAGVRHLEVALLGDADTHDALAARPGAAERLTAGVRAFADAGAAQGVPVCVSARVAVCRHNLPHVAGAVADAARMGATAVTLQVADAAARSAGASAWIAAALETGVVNGVWVSVAGMEPPVSPLHAIEAAPAIGAPS